MPKSSTSPSADAIIIGGGAVGCAVAFVLAREGLRVTLFEERELASGASGAMAGMLAPIAEANEPGPSLRFGLDALRMHPLVCAELLERSGIDPEYVRSGLLRLARNDTQAQALRAHAAMLRAYAEEAIHAGGDLQRFAPLKELEWVEAEALRDLAPGVSSDVSGGLWSPAEAQLRSPLLTRAYAGAAERLGARIESGARVLGLERSGNRVVGVRTAQGLQSAGSVIVCAGSWSGIWLEDSLAGGFESPRSAIVPERGQLVAVDPIAPGFASIVWAGSTYLVPKRDGSLVIGATSEDVGFDASVTASGVATLLESARSLAPGLADARFLWAWAGLRPMSRDGHASIGRVPGAESLYVASGHHRNGVMLSYVTAGLIRDSLLGKALPEDAAVFDPARWK